MTDVNDFEDPIIKKARELFQKIEKERSSKRSLASSNASVIPYEVAAQLNMQSFLEHHFEGYLLGDLESMATLIPPDKHPGGVGYPMVQTVCAGIEFLGLLTRPGGDDFESAQDIQYFGHYWKNYLSKLNSQYAPYGQLARELVRNGLAHNFMTKAHIGVNRDSPELHMKIKDDLLIINCVKFYEDLKDSYQKLARPYILSPTGGLKTADHRLNSMLRKYSRQSDEEFAKLKLPKKKDDDGTYTTASGIAM